MRRNVCASALVLAIAAAPSTPTASAAPHVRAKGDDLARARALDKEGAKAYGEGRYNDAIRYFEEAYRLGGPAFELWNIAKCHLRLDQPEEAAEMLERYLAVPDLPEEDREEASRQLATLRERPSTLTVSSTPTGAEVVIDGERVEGRTPLSTSVPPGAHTVTIRSEEHPPYTREIEARYGRAIILDADLAAEAGEGAPPPPAASGDREAAGVALRGGLGVVLPKWGSIGGGAGAGLLALGTYRVGAQGDVTFAVGGLFSVASDSWQDRTEASNEAPGCPTPLVDAERATAMSLFGIATAAVPIAPRLRLVGIGGLGLAGYSARSLGGDLFVPTCDPSPGVRPAMLFGAELDYELTSRVRLSAFPLTFQVQPAFDGVRGAPRDASGIWMRFGFGLGAGVDL